LSKPDLKIDFVIGRLDFQNAGYVSSYIKKELTKRNLDSRTIRRTVIASFEAEINVVIHSFGGMCQFVLDKGKIQLTFKDYGPGIEDVTQAMQKGYTTASKEAIEHGFGAGMGLHNIEQAADKLEISSSKQGTILKITILIQPRDI
jgi:serine/threonine-protein kinase RsbT